MTDLLPIARFPLPEDLEVSETMCVTIRIPNDQQYLSTLIGLLDMLKWSRNFARDDSGTGAAVVSRTWQTALESEPISVEDCDMPEFRINPETCLLEVNCSDDPESPDWQTITTPATDPRTDIKYPPPYPDAPPEGQSNECLAAANISAWVWIACGGWAGQLTYGIFAQFVVQVMGVIGGLFTLLTDIIIDNTTTLFTEIDLETIEGDFAALDQQDFIDIIVCYLDSDGSMPSDNWGDFLDHLLAQAGDNQAWYLVHYCMLLVGWGGINLLGKIGGITEAECGSCGDWTITQDLTASDGGWVGEDGLAVWVDGVGWRPTTWATHIQMRLYFDTSITTLFELFRVEVVNNTGDERVGYRVEFLDDSDTIIMNDQIIYSTETYFQWAGSVAGVKSARIFIFYFNGDPSNIEVTFVRFDGTGAEPTI